MGSQPLDLRLLDVSTLLHVVRIGSVSGAARTVGVTPSQVSKAVARLERALGARLLKRGTSGVALTEAGKRRLPLLESMVEDARLLAGDEPELPTLTFMASAFLNSLCMPAIARSLPSVRWACVETPPGLASAYAAAGLFDLALTLTAERWPRAWVAVRAGAIRKSLYATPPLARQLGRPPIAPARLRGERFIAPIYSYNGQVLAGDDGCPLDARERVIGYRTQTLSLALELAAQSGQLIFAPELAARFWVERGKLVEVPVEGWSVKEPLQVVCHERLSSTVQRRIVHAVREVVS